MFISLNIRTSKFFQKIISIIIENQIISQKILLKFANRVFVKKVCIIIQTTLYQIFINTFEKANLNLSFENIKARKRTILQIQNRNSKIKIRIFYLITKAKYIYIAINIRLFKYKTLTLLVFNTQHT